MRGRPLSLLLAFACAFPASAAAAPVLVMGRDGAVSKRNDRFLSASALTPAPSAAPAPVGAPASVAKQPRASIARARRSPKKARRRTVTSVLVHLYRTGSLDQADYDSYRASWTQAVSTDKRLRGTPASELGAVIGNLRSFAAAGQLTLTRLPALFLTLERNRQWWSSGPVPGTYQRVEFQGSQLVWEYYPGQGIELQVLGSFGKANGLYTAGKSDYPQLQELLGELIPLAVHRAGGLAWEYYFHFDGGSPPWVSAMAQGTALEAIGRAGHVFGPDPYFQVGSQALSLFTVPPPVGVRIGTSLGARYLQYSFAPQTDIINAFLQSLIGLYDYASSSGSAEAQTLFAAGNAQAEAELPRFDTGAWSLYQPGIEDDLSYHTLVTGFLDTLCGLLHVPVYCTTAEHFHAYLKTPPVLRLLTTHAKKHTPFTLRFTLSKYSNVGVVISRGSSDVFLTSADFPYGTDTFSVPPLRRGNYTVLLRGTDLPGNTARITATLRVR